MSPYLVSRCILNKISAIVVNGRRQVSQGTEFSALSPNISVTRNIRLLARVFVQMAIIHRFKRFGRCRCGRSNTECCTVINRIEWLHYSNQIIAHADAELFPPSGRTYARKSVGQVAGDLRVHINFHIASISFNRSFCLLVFLRWAYD